jgi:hypothetical protein
MRRKIIVNKDGVAKNIGIIEKKAVKTTMSRENIYREKLPNRFLIQ